jgi:hypothetical protein
MDKYYRMVIDLYKERITNGNVDPERILDVKKAIACAQTEAKILDKPQDGFTELIADIDFLRDQV